MTTATAKRSLRETILGAQDIALQERQVPEWDAVVYMRKLSHGQGMALINGLKKDDAEQEFYVSLLILSLADGDGVALFTEDDRDALGAKAGAVIKGLAEDVQAFNGMGVQAQEAIEGN